MDWMAQELAGSALHGGGGVLRGRRAWGEGEDAGEGEGEGEGAGVADLGLVEISDIG